MIIAFQFFHINMIFFMQQVCCTIRCANGIKKSLITNSWSMQLLFLLKPLHHKHFKLVDFFLALHQYHICLSFIELMQTFLPARLRECLKCGQDIQKKNFFSMCMHPFRFLLSFFLFLWRKFFWCVMWFHFITCCAKDLLIWLIWQVLKN